MRQLVSAKKHVLDRPPPLLGVLEVIQIDDDASEGCGGQPEHAPRRVREVAQDSQGEIAGTDAENDAAVPQSKANPLGVIQMHNNGHCVFEPSGSSSAVGHEGTGGGVTEALLDGLDVTLVKLPHAASVVTKTAVEKRGEVGPPLRGVLGDVVVGTEALDALEDVVLGVGTQLLQQGQGRGRGAEVDGELVRVRVRVLVRKELGLVRVLGLGLVRIVVMLLLKLVLLLVLILLLLLLLVLLEILLLLMLWRPIQMTTPRVLTRCVRTSGP